MTDARNVEVRRWRLSMHWSGQQLKEKKNRREANFAHDVNRRTFKALLFSLRGQAQEVAETPSPKQG